jgi:hypothetical protein
MSTPAEFNIMCGCLHQDSLIGVSTIDQLVNVAIDGLTVKQRRMLATFIGEITSELKTDGDLQEMWRASPSELLFKNGDHVRTFLMLVRARIEEG